MPFLCCLSYPKGFYTVGTENVFKSFSVLWGRAEIDRCQYVQFCVAWLSFNVSGLFLGDCYLEEVYVPHTQWHLCTSWHLGLRRNIKNKYNFSVCPYRRWYICEFGLLCKKRCTRYDNNVIFNTLYECNFFLVFHIVLHFASACTFCWQCTIRI
jgi:hypothetical protein